MKLADTAIVNKPSTSFSCVSSPAFVFKPVHSWLEKNLSLEILPDLVIPTGTPDFVLQTPDIHLKVGKTDLTPNHLFALVEQYSAGNISSALKHWEKLTSDKNIIAILKYGLSLQFMSLPQPKPPFTYVLDAEATQMVDTEIEKLLKTGAVVPTTITSSDYFSPIFPRTNKDGTPRIILNLKTLNETIEAIHFKMESIHYVINMVRQNCWMASVDLKSAFYSVPIHPNHQHYLNFFWGIPYKFVVMPNGYADAPRVFTKLLKPAFASLRSQGYCSVVYLDDSYLQGNTYMDCLLNIHETVHTLQQLGFTIHPKKSVLIPTQTIEFLGFLIDSVAMTITLPQGKMDKIKTLCRVILTTPNPTIREVAQLIGNLVAATEAVPLAPLHFRTLENEKIVALKQRKGNFDCSMVLTPLALSDISWWLNNIDLQVRHILPVPISLTIYCDASKLGWGAQCATQHAGGHWLQNEWETADINVMELTAAKFALFSFCKPDKVPEDPAMHGNRHIPLLSEDPLQGNRQHSQHVRLVIDNITAVSYINHMGGSHSLACNALSREIWTWAEEHHLWLSAAHIPGVDNSVADHYSRKFDDTKEWSITIPTFQVLTTILGHPDIDLFASRTNRKVTPYVSWHPDPGSLAVDAFSIPWSQPLVYCFPPFSLIWKTLSKIWLEKATAILIAPLWHTQSWYPYALQLIVDHPIVFPASRHHLYLPHKPQETHQLHPGLHLMALKLSGDCYKTTAFLHKLKNSSFPHGGLAHGRNMRVYLPNGKAFVVDGILIPFVQL